MTENLSWNVLCARAEALHKVLQENTASRSALLRGEDVVRSELQQLQPLLNVQLDHMKYGNVHRILRPYPDAMRRLRAMFILQLNDKLPAPFRAWDGSRNSAAGAHYEVSWRLPVESDF